MFSAEHPQLRHDAIFYDDESALASAAVAFVREGIDRDELVLVSRTNPVSALVRAMFDGEERVVFLDRHLYSTPAGAIDRFRRVMERGLDSGIKGYRAMGFIDFDATPLPWQEWLRYEAVANRVFADFPFTTLCPYDTTTITGEMADAIMRCHVGLVDQRGRHENDNYVEPEKLVVCDGLVTPPHPLQATAPRMEFEPSDDLTELRMEIYSATMFTSLDRLRIDDFVKAVGEVVLNAHKHGADPVLLKLWASDSAVVCTVTDRGPGIADPLAGYARPRHPSEGLGLWATRQLVDVLDYEQAPDGFTVRLACFA